MIAPHIVPLEITNMVDTVEKPARRVNGVVTWHGNLNATQIRWSEWIFRQGGIPLGRYLPLLRRLEGSPSWIRDRDNAS